MDVNGGEQIKGSFCDDTGCYEVYINDRGERKTRPLKVEIEVRG